MSARVSPKRNLKIGLIFSEIPLRDKSMKKYDHIIVGTGQATGTLLGKLIPTGARIAVIEANKIGGSCVNYGCTPTKTMVASARNFHQAGRGAYYGFEA